jgi:hypothetical protein
MAADSWVYDGATWRNISEWWAYDGASWRDIQEAWSYDGSVWRKVFEVSSCVCGTTTIDTTTQTYNPSGCTCQTTPKVIKQSKRCIRWNYSTTEALACVKAQIQYNVSGGSYTTEQTVELNQSAASAGGICTGTTYEGYAAVGFSGGCVNDNRQYRVRAVVTGGGTVCSTGALQNTVNCIA